MKNKKVLAIALSIGIFTSSFSGVFISYAKNESAKSNNTSNITSESIEDYTSLAPTPVITELEIDNNTQELLVNSNTIKNNGKEKVVIYQGQKKIFSDDTESKDMFYIDTEEINELMENGYSIQEIFEADEIGNEIGEDPKALLERKRTDNKSLKEVKKDILQEQKDKSIDYLMKNYKTEYKKLKNKDISKEDAYALLQYIDISNKKLTDDIIDEYKKRGKEIFILDNKHKVSNETKKKYGLSDKEADAITDETIISLEKLAKKVNKPAKDIIKAYIKKNN